MLTRHANEHDSKRGANFGGAWEELADALGNGVGGDVVIGRMLAEQSIADTAPGKVRDVAVVAEAADDPDRAGTCSGWVGGSGHSGECTKAARVVGGRVRYVRTGIARVPRVGLILGRASRALGGLDGLLGSDQTGMRAERARTCTRGAANPMVRCLQLSREHAA